MPLLSGQELVSMMKSNGKIDENGVHSAIRYELESGIVLECIEAIYRHHKPDVARWTAEKIYEWSYTFKHNQIQNTNKSNNTNEYCSHKNKQLHMVSAVILRAFELEKYELSVYCCF